MKAGKNTPNSEDLNNVCRRQKVKKLANDDYWKLQRNSWKKHIRSPNV